MNSSSWNERVGHVLFLPQYKGIATYIVPRIDVSVSGTFTSKPGIQVSGFGTRSPVARLRRITSFRTLLSCRFSAVRWPAAHRISPST